MFQNKLIVFSLYSSSSLQFQYLRPPSLSRFSVCSLNVDIAVHSRSLSRVWGLRGALQSGQKMTNKWQEEEVATLRVMNHSAQHTRNSSKWKQRAQGADFGYFCSVSLSALWDSSLLLGTSIRPVSPKSLNLSLSKCQSHSNPNYNLPVQQSSKPRPHFSCL